MSTTTDNWTDVEATAKRVLGEDIVAFIGQCRTPVERAERDSHLIAVLHKVQAKFRYLAEAHLDAVAQLMQVPAAKVAGVASFYHYFRLSPRGKYIINVCLGTACYVKGAGQVQKAVEHECKCKFGETTADGTRSSARSPSLLPCWEEHFHTRNLSVCRFAGC